MDEIKKKKHFFHQTQLPEAFRTTCASVCILSQEKNSLAVLNAAITSIYTRAGCSYINCVTAETGIIN